MQIDKTSFKKQLKFSFIMTVVFFVLFFISVFFEFDFFVPIASLVLSMFSLGFFFALTWIDKISFE